MTLNDLCKFLLPDTPNLNRHKFFDLSLYLFVKGSCDRWLHICILTAYLQKFNRLRDIKLHIDGFVMTIRTLSEEASTLND